ncbi:MAG: hypothetical protein HQ546_03415, partial [Planctomycetes bacterium]|nr:hypothetical protein [Planctomycetota bacterium]
MLLLLVRRKLVRRVELPLFLKRVCVMISRIHSMVLQGIDATVCEVEVDAARGGLAEIRLVGLPDAAVKEAISRVQSAMRNSGYRWPGPKVTINLAPADVKKEGPAFDLPIALGAM